MYTGDAGRTAALPRLARDASLLLAECSLTEPDSGPHGHLCAENAAEAACHAGAYQLVLTHFSSADPARLWEHRRRAEAVFPSPVHLARPRTRFSVDSSTSPHSGAET